MKQLLEEAMARAVSEIEQEIRALPDADKERVLHALLELARRLT
jgi:hypothetical protein